MGTLDVEMLGTSSRLGVRRRIPRPSRSSFLTMGGARNSLNHIGREGVVGLTHRVTLSSFLVSHSRFLITLISTHAHTYDSSTYLSQSMYTVSSKPIKATRVNHANELNEPPRV